MMPSLLGAAFAIALCAAAMVAILLDERRFRYSFTSLGGDAHRRHPDAASVVFLEYARQQRWAFGLLWSTLAIAVVLSTSLAVGYLTSGSVNTQSLREFTALSIDGCLAGGAAKLYRAASRRLDKAAKELGARDEQR